MGINKQTLETGTIQIGPTDQAMVRVHVATQDYDIPMDFEPDEAEEIARELLSAAEIARANASKPAKKKPSK